MAAAELTALLGPPSSRPLSTSTAVQILSLLRQARLPRPDLVLQLGAHALSHLSLRTRTHWDVAAQICAAAADTREWEIMHTTLARIIARFPHSPRAFALLARTREARGLLHEAMDTCIGVVAKEPMAPLVYKRQVAILKGQLNMPEAVALLNHYLSHYSDDLDAWAELCALSLALGRFNHAVFAASELVVADPRNHAFQTLAADVYMTCGGKANVLRAREHYACSLRARKHANLRALYGMWLACSRLTDNHLLDGEEACHNHSLLVVAQAGIQAVYAKLQKESAASAALGTTAVVVINCDIVTGKGKHHTKNIS